MYNEFFKKIENFYYLVSKMDNLWYALSNDKKKRNCKYDKFKKLHEKYSNCCFDVILIKYSFCNHFSKYHFSII